MTVKRIFLLLIITTAIILAAAVPANAKDSQNQSITMGISFSEPQNPIYINISEGDGVNITSDDEYKNYMRSFSSNIILLLVLFISGAVLLILNISGRKYSRNFFYIERFLLRVILIPAYSVMGILLILVSLFTIALIGGSPDIISEILLSFLFSCVIFTYAVTSLWLAYSIVAKKVYMFILAFEITAPLLILLFSFEDPQNYENLLDLSLGIIFFLILAAIPVMHTQMLRKRRKISPLINHIPDESKDAGRDTLPANIEQEAILMQSQKINSLPADLSERYMDAVYIGKGGTARIFRAKRRNDGQTVAVKVPISFDERTGRSFLKEINIWKELSHKNIVKVYSVNILPIPFVEMEYCEKSLAEIQKPSSVNLSLLLIKGIAEGLLYAHKRGVLHRDIKPQNILIAKDCTPKITDWGLGKLIGDNSETKTIAFSLNYASPEQVAPGIFGHSDERADIFQLGVVFYELLTGKLPFSGEGIAEFSCAIIKDQPRPPSVYSQDAKKLDKLVIKCLEKYPDDRYQSIEEFIEDLNRLHD